MAKHNKKAKPTKTVYSASEIAALNTVNGFGGIHAEYSLERFAERDKTNGAMDSARMRRVACARALEGLAVKHPKAKEPFLNPRQLTAASLYQSALDECQGGGSHEIVERVQMSGSPDMAQCYQIDCLNEVASISNRMDPALNKTLRIALENRDQTLAALWPNRAQQNAAKDRIKAGLTWLVEDYGL